MVFRTLLAGCALLLSTGVSAPPNNTKHHTSAAKKLVIHNPTPPPVVKPKIGNPKPMDLTYDQQTEIFLYAKSAIADQCREQPMDLWCTKVNLATKDLDPLHIVTLSMMAKRHFNYRSDIVDNWRVHSSEAMLSQEWYGDCDDLASTTLDIMARSGQPLNKLWFLLVDVNHTATLDHMVGMIQDDNGDYWIIGDTAGQSVYPVSELKYRVVAAARADNVSAWMDPHLVGAFPAETLQSVPIVAPLRLYMEGAKP